MTTHRHIHCKYPSEPVNKRSGESPNSDTKKERDRKLRPLAKPLTIDDIENVALT